MYKYALLIVLAITLQAKSPYILNSFKVKDKYTQHNVVDWCMSNNTVWRESRLGVGGSFSQILHTKYSKLQVLKCKDYKDWYKLK